MTVEQSLIDFLLTLFESSTCHVGFPHSFDFLQAMFFAELVKTLVDVIQPFAKLFAGEHLHDGVEFCDVTKDYGYFSLVVSNKSLPLSDPLPNQIRHQYMQYRFEFLEFLDLFLALPEFNPIFFLHPV